MKNLLTAALILVVAMPVLGVNGSVEMIGEIRILNVWGSWEEMGYAYGYLLGPDLVEVYEGYFLELAGTLSNVEILRTYFPTYFTVPQEFSDYADAVIAGASDSISLYSPVYGRNIDALDLLIVSSVPDLSAAVDFKHLFCSSTSAWGSATETDPDLQGSPAISRNLDYYVDSNETILDQCIIVVHDPDPGQEWISVTFPGFLGTLSGMNETGLNATLDMGNYSGTSQTSTSFVPICMALALGLSSDDFDGSGTCDIQDLMEASTEWNVANTYDIHITSPSELGYLGNPAVITEVNNHLGSAFRYVSDEPSIAPDRMILTNHHRVLYPPVSCNRYSRLLDSLTTDTDVTLDRLWNFMGAVGEVPVAGLGGTIQTMIFQPDQRRVGIAFASSGIAPYEKAPEWIEWSDIYPNHDPMSVESDPVQPVNMQLYPNPASSTIYVTGEVSTPYCLTLFDLTGRKLDVTFTQRADEQFTADVSNLGSGLYLVVNSSAHGNETVSFLILQ